MIEILRIIIIDPLILFYETIFQYVFSHTKNAGFSIIVLSLILNIVLLPIYRKIEEIQNQENLIQKDLKPGISKIKKAFKGNERYLILQTYYKQKNYNPLNVLKNILPLLIEMPFFIAAYMFLSNLACLEGRGFLFIKNLGQPDELMFGLNLLPIIMTIINVISCIIYTKEQPIKTKIQLYLMAFVFLILLYKSPSGLSLYYLLNNVFSLIKNIVFKYARKKESEKDECINNDKYLFFCCCIFLTILTGLFIPTQVLNSSTEDFVSLVDSINPLNYVFNSFLLSAGVFMLWINIYYKFANNKIKKLLTIIMVLICCNALVNHLLFKQNLGILTYLLKYDVVPSFSSSDYIFNTITIILISIIIVFIYNKKSNIFRTLVCVLCMSLCILIIKNSIDINNEYKSVCKRKEANMKDSFTLSKNKQNVVVIMLDRAISQFFPYLLEEKSILQKQFAGFTYYPNTISFGHNTNVGTPGLFGGYEYTPEESNKRDDILLVEKQNEALKVMPVIFDSNGFDVTVFDPPLAGYKQIPDLTIYNDYPNINRYNTGGSIYNTSLNKLNRNLFCYSLVRIAPTLAFSFLYDGGDYSKMKELDTTDHPIFLDKYKVLCNLINYTEIVDSDEGSFLMFQNESTHDPTELQLPDYEFSNIVDNNDYYEENMNKVSIYGDKLTFDSYTQMIYYHANMASMLRIGDWLDYLRENDVYDNTKIIIVSDHGSYLRLRRDLLMKGNDLMMYNALLLVKDFDSQEFSVDNSFMTNADVPYIATKEVIQNPVNPFTNKPIVEVEKENRTFNVLDSYFNVNINNGYRYSRGTWYSVHDDCLNIDNWKKIDDPSK